MFKSWSKALKIASVYIGVILGAGFTSGSEIMKFFMQYKQFGFYGLMLSAILFGLIGWIILDLTFINRFKNGNDLIKHIMGEKIGYIIEILSGAFMFILLCTMLAAGGAVGNEIFGINKSIGIIFISITVMITMFFDLNGVIAINMVLSPIMIVGGIIIGLYSFFMGSIEAFKSTFVNFNFYNNWIVSAITYVCYNIITAISVLTTMGNNIDSRKTAFMGAMLGGVVICILGLSLAIPLFFNFDRVYFLELPLFGIIKQYNNAIKYIYIIILLIAVYVTAVVNGFGILNWMNKKINLSSTKKILVIILISILVAHIGFSNFVGKVYALFGAIGFFEITVIVLNYILINNKNRQNIY